MNARTVEIPLPALWAARHRQVRWVGAGISVTFALLGGFIVSIPFRDVTRPVSATFLRDWAWAWSAAFILLAAVLIPLLTGTDREALAVTANVPLILRLDDAGLSIPLLLVTNPAYWKGAKRRAAHLSIAWRDVARWTVQKAQGKAPAQHFLSLQGDAAAWGTGLFGTGPLWGDPGFGILRRELRQHEKEIVSAANAHLSEPVVLNDELN